MMGIHILRVYINIWGFSKFKQITWHLVKVLMLKCSVLGWGLRFCVMIFNGDKIYIT